jgi:Fe-S cluster assembly protein SufD
MADVKKVVVKKRRDEKEDLREFSFLDSPLRVSGVSEKVKRYRLQAYESYQTLPFPTHQDEPWRRTPLKGFKPGQFVLDADDGLPDQVDPLREAWQDVEVAGSVAVVNGSAVEIKLDPKLAEKGVIFTDLITAEDEYPEIVDRIIGEAVPAGESKFSSLSGAFSQNGIVLYVPEKLDIKIPFRALLWLSGEHRAVFSHVLVLLERSSSATFVLEYGSNYDGGQEQFHSGIVEILLEDAARLKFEEFQAYGKNVWNFSQERAVLGRDSDFVWNHGAFGSKLTKNFIDTKLMGEGANARMNGLYILDDYQHHDHDTRVS